MDKIIQKSLAAQLVYSLSKPHLYKQPRVGWEISHVFEFLTPVLAGLAHDIFFYRFESNGDEIIYTK